MTERLKKDIIKLVIDEVVIDGEKLKIVATIPLPTKIHEREIVKADTPDTFNSGATLGPINETKMERIWNKHKQLNTTLKPKVFVAMSGGVDSSVAAALLKNAGYDVTGVFMKVWYPDFVECSWPEDRLDAMRVCAHLDIPFLTWDFEAEYKKAVVDYMIESYRRGETPNPDVMCNKHIKFDAFYKKAMAAGANYIATGHHAHKRKSKNEKIKSYELATAKDTNKDQTYFLWTLTQDVLHHTLFPVGTYTKPEVRQVAREFGLPTAEKQDSQGLCFIGKVDMKEFLKHYIETTPGDVIDERGNVVGTHDGALLYTLGERHGFTITTQKPHESPHYIIDKDAKNNTLTVSHTTMRRRASNSCEVRIIGTNWISGAAPDTDATYYARTRYRQELHPCTIAEVTKNTTIVVFEKAPPLAPSGQSLVVYDTATTLGTDNNICLGGGIITT